MTGERLQRISSHFSEYGPILRTTRLRALGVCSKDIQELLRTKRIVRIKDGYYVLNEQLASLSDAQIAVSVIPSATLCFLSAAQVYDLTSVIPDAVYVAARNIGKAPTLPAFPPVALMQYKEPLFSLGRTSISVEGAVLPIYDRERTVCDFIKRRGEVGKDDVLEVIRRYMLGNRDLQTLYFYAERLRVRHILNPYVEAML